jgi:hypothetical protein
MEPGSLKVVVAMTHSPTTFGVTPIKIKKSADDYLFCFQLWSSQTKLAAGLQEAYSRLTAFVTGFLDAQETPD